MIATITGSVGTFYLNTMYVRELKEWLGYLVKDGKYYASIPISAVNKQDLVNMAVVFLSDNYKNVSFSVTKTT